MSKIQTLTNEEIQYVTGAAGLGIADFFLNLTTPISDSTGSLNWWFGWVPGLGAITATINSIAQGITGFFTQLKSLGL